MSYKFRAWDKIHHEMYEWEIVKSEFTMSDFENVDLLMMQFTGLTDVNGIEICEGDIVSLQNPFDLINYKSLIIFKDGGFCAIDGTEENYAVRRYRLSDSDLEITVLGNIYQDEHLLKEN